MLLLYWSHVTMHTIPVNFLYFPDRFDLILAFHVYKLFFEAVAEGEGIFFQHKVSYNKRIIKKQKYFIL